MNRGDRCRKRRSKLDLGETSVLREGLSLARLRHLQEEVAFDLNMEG